MRGSEAVGRAREGSCIAVLLDWVAIVTRSTSTRSRCYKMILESTTTVFDYLKEFCCIFVIELKKYHKKTLFNIKKTTMPQFSHCV